MFGDAGHGLLLLLFALYMILRERHLVNSTQGNEVCYFLCLTLNYFYFQERRDEADTSCERCKKQQWLVLRKLLISCGLSLVPCNFALISFLFVVIITCTITVLFIFC